VFVQILLRRVDPALRAARYYVVSLEATLFCEHTFVRRWGRIGSNGRSRLELFEGQADAVALDAWLNQKRRHGYQVC
jgi:predicted DNA-binding WGR domain protein